MGNICKFFCKKTDIIEPIISTPSYFMNNINDISGSTVIDIPIQNNLNRENQSKSSRDYYNKYLAGTAILI
jgi:hypothetical protein